MRLDKFVCKSTSLSRAQAVECIRAGHVVVNDIAVLVESAQVHENNTFMLNAQLLKPLAFRYLMIHKPANTICSNVDEACPSLFSDLDLDRSDELHVAGRLDADTTGLVLATNDGRWSFDIIHPQKQCKKVYRVGLSNTIEEAQVAELILKFAAGLALHGEAQLTRPAQLKILGRKEVFLTISEDKFHQVKRMFTHVGNRVVSLHREKIGEVSLDIELGAWRYLTAAEVACSKGET